MFQTFEPVQRVVGLHRDDLDLRIDFFQIAADAHDRAAGADAGEEMGYFAVRLAINFRPGIFIVGLRDSSD